MTDAEQIIGLKNLREEFPQHLVSKLPKPTAKREEMDKLPKSKCKECGGYHATSKVIHLDYVGHAALTHRLLDVDPFWSWEPLAMDANGLPRFDANGGMWIKLTVCGVTRLGYGDADGKSGGNAIKECIGDALRNAAMRFGCALDLWHKGDLHDASKRDASLEWADDDIKDAKASVYALADKLLDLGCKEEEQAALISKPLSTIGDNTIGPEKWNNRFIAYADRVIADHGGAK